MNAAVRNIRERLMLADAEVFYCAFRSAWQGRNSGRMARWDELDLDTQESYRIALDSFLDAAKLGALITQSEFREREREEKRAVPPAADEQLRATILDLTNRVKRLEVAIENVNAFTVGEPNFYVTIYKRSGVNGTSPWQAQRTLYEDGTYTNDDPREFKSIWEALTDAMAWLHEPKTKKAETK